MALLLAGGQMASPDQINTLISAAVMSAERYYPAFQLVVYGVTVAPKMRFRSPLPRLTVARNNLPVIEDGEPHGHVGYCRARLGAIGLWQNGIGHARRLADRWVTRNIGLCA